MAPIKYTIDTINKYSGLNSDTEASDDEGKNKTETLGAGVVRVSATAGQATASGAEVRIAANREVAPKALLPVQTGVNQLNVDGSVADVRFPRGSQRGNNSFYRGGRGKFDRQGGPSRRPYRNDSVEDGPASGGSYSNNAGSGNAMIRPENDGGANYPRVSHRRGGRGREFDRQSGTGRGREVKREGGGRFNWGGGMTNEERADIGLSKDRKAVQKLSSEEPIAVPLETTESQSEELARASVEEGDEEKQEEVQKQSRRNMQDEEGIIDFQSWKMQQMASSGSVTAKKASGINSDTKQEMESQGYKFYQKENLKDEAGKNIQVNGNLSNEEIDSKRKKTRNIVEYFYPPGGYSDSFSHRGRGRRNRGGGGGKGGEGRYSESRGSEARSVESRNTPDFEAKEKLEYRVRDAPDLQDNRAFPSLIE